MAENTTEEKSERPTFMTTEVGAFIAVPEGQFTTYASIELPSNPAARALYPDYLIDDSVPLHSSIYVGTGSMPDLEYQDRVDSGQAALQATHDRLTDASTAVGDAQGKISNVPVPPAPPPPLGAPTLTSINPTSLPVGPPADTVLTCTGTGFAADSQIRFGANLERTDFVSDTEVSTIITAGLFPGEDPAVPVTVFTPGGGESDPQTFAFTAATKASEPPTHATHATHARKSSS